MQVPGDFSVSARCALVLAGGDGERLRPLVHQMRGDSLPKQYVNFIGARSMLEHTFHRAEKLIPKERIFTVVSRGHLSYPGVRRQLSSRPRQTVISQPRNRDTGPGILIPLMHVRKRYPNSTVVVFPSDHFIVEEDLFISHVALAFEAVEHEPLRLVLLGFEPSEPETEYGYILPDGTDGSPFGIHRVEKFVEKPDSTAARKLILQRGLWNSMVMVFKIRTLLEVVRRQAPELYAYCRRILRAIGTRSEPEVVEEVYRNMRPLNFSRELLATLPGISPSSLAVLPAHGVYWSDWGLPHCVQRVLKKIGHPAQLHSPDAMGKNRLFKLMD